MIWEIKYKIKGCNMVFGEFVDLHFEKPSEVKKWWDMNRKYTEVDLSAFGIKFIKGQRQDREFQSAKPLKHANNEQTEDSPSGE